MILRINRRENPFVQIDKRALEDARLSWKAKGILAYLLSKPDGWTVLTEDLIKHGTDGRDAVRSAMAELRKYGYASLEKARGEDGTLAGQEWHIYEEPRIGSLAIADLPDSTVVHREPENPSLGTENRKTRLSDNPTVGKSATSNNNSSVRITEREIGRATRFIPPTIEKCREEAKGQGLPETEGDAFFDHHKARGWIPSGQRTQMKDWQAAMRQWARTYRRINSPRPVNGKPARILTPEQEDYAKKIAMRPY